MAQQKDDVSMIIQEFVESWQEVVKFYATISQNRPYLRIMLPVIGQLRRKGYDKIFRAGTGLEILFLSRSQKYGLRNAQPFVAISPSPERKLHIRYASGGYPWGEGYFVEDLHSDSITISPDVEAFVQRLAEHPID